MVTFQLFLAASILAAATIFTASTELRIVFWRISEYAFQGIRPAGCDKIPAMSQTARRRFLKTVAGSAALGAAAGGEEGAAGKRYPFVQWDVFSSEKLRGNPLAVFTDARGLADAGMSAIARETNLSETTFIFPREASVERERGVLVRIFTPREELPFAGHPTLGTAMALRAGRFANATEIALELKAGKIPVTFHTESDGKVFGEMQQKD